MSSLLPFLCSDIILAVFHCSGMHLSLYINSNCLASGVIKISAPSLNILNGILSNPSQILIFKCTYSAMFSRMPLLSLPVVSLSSARFWYSEHMVLARQVLVSMSYRNNASSTLWASDVSWMPWSSSSKHKVKNFLK